MSIKHRLLCLELIFIITFDENSHNVKQGGNEIFGFFTLFLIRSIPSALRSWRTRLRGLSTQHAGNVP